MRYLTLAFLSVLVTCSAVYSQAPVEIGFLWHMHQPTYRPGETILETENSGVFSFSIVDVHNQRFGPYTSWPRDAIQAGSGLANLGASVSFSGSLIRNLDALESAGVNGGMWNHWESSYQQAAGWQTALGNSRLDLVNFGFNHPLFPLLDARDIAMQIRLQKHIHAQRFPGVPASRGIFPPETAFSTRIIPALVNEGIEWAIVDSIHVERATVGYPHTNASGLYAPNPADQINPELSSQGSQWVNLNGLWAPSAVAAPFAYRPHFAQHVDPDTGMINRIVIVPGARYEGNEDGRGGFGALQYETVMNQYRQLNTDPTRPMLVLLHHDGDNFGGGSESYYHGNFNSMVNWLNGNSNYNVTTIQDYLDRFPVDANDVVHVENGSWAGADAGDPEFKKWLGDPDGTGFSPDRNSWAVLTAARNRVFTADDISPAVDLDNVINGVGSSTERAWHTLLQAQGSDHWYWDGTQVWDSNVTLGCNQATSLADPVINSFGGTESTPPTVFVPQREPYNPGGFEFGSEPEPSDFEVWTYAYDVSGLESVTLYYRLDLDGVNPLASIQNETFQGGVEVDAWVPLPMASTDVIPPGNILTPNYRALRYGATIAGLENVLVDYYVEAIDNQGVVTRTDIQHVFVGMGPTQGGDAVEVDPDPPIAGQAVTIHYDAGSGPLANASEIYLHYGINGWSTVYADELMDFDAQTQRWTAQVPVASDASTLDLVFNDGAGNWDNNGGQDWHFDVEGTGDNGFQLDGQLDATAELLATNNGQNLYFGLSANHQLYVATEDAGEGDDVFIYVAENPGALQPANWAKSGQIAAWDGFLADENDNDFHQWFDLAGQSATGANGGVLEGVLDLPAIYGARPDSIWLAVGRYQTSDGGALDSSSQVPGTLDGDGDLQAIEWIELELATTTELEVESFAITRGEYSQGGLVDLLESDNSDLVAQRSPSDITSRVFATFETTSPVDSPTSIQFSIESAVFARSTVELSMDFFDYDSGQWQQVFVGTASRFTDAVESAEGENDLSRFVEPVTGRLQARVRYQSINHRQQFSANIDQVRWTVGH